MRFKFSDGTNCEVIIPVEIHYNEMMSYRPSTGGYDPTKVTCYSHFKSQYPSITGSVKFDLSSNIPTLTIKVPGMYGGDIILYKDK